MGPVCMDSVRHTCIWISWPPLSLNTWGYVAGGKPDFLAFVKSLLLCLHPEVQGLQKSSPRHEFLPFFSPPPSPPCSCSAVSNSSCILRLRSFRSNKQKDFLLLSACFFSSIYCSVSSICKNLCPFTACMFTRAHLKFGFLLMEAWLFSWSVGMFFSW